MALSNTDSQMNGYDVLFDFFNQLGVIHFFGVTGGGVIHFLKYLAPYPHHPHSSFFTIAEYHAGFAPIGYYLTTRQLAACVATFGAATKLLTCGLSDAKQHDIPSIYIVPAYDKCLNGKSPLQDSSCYGSNLIEQLKAECPENVLIFDEINKIFQLLEEAKKQLEAYKPVVLVLIHSCLSSIAPSNRYSDVQLHDKVPESSLKLFARSFVNAANNKKITVLVGEEMNLYPEAKTLTTLLSAKLKPYLVWSMNGANAVQRDNNYGYGYVGFGGNDLANVHFNQLDSDDVLLVLGACPDEYTINLNNFTAGHTFFCTNIKDGYGQVDGSFSHRADHQYQQLNYSLDAFIHELLKDEYRFENIPAPVAPHILNTRKILPPNENFTDMKDVYLRLDQWWPANSIAFSDVCLAYKDRQYMTQRPNDNIEFYSLYRGSAMGHVLGLAIGAKLADTTKHVFAFTGDGCFKLLAGSLAEAAPLGITLFVLNNAKFSIVDQGLKAILPNTPSDHWHSAVQPVDYCAIARASGWKACHLNIDLSNLEVLLDSTIKQRQSLLIEIAVDPDQLLGINPRVHNL